MHLSHTHTLTCVLLPIDSKGDCAFDIPDGLELDKVSTVLTVEGINSIIQGASGGQVAEKVKSII